MTQLLDDTIAQVLAATEPSLGMSEGTALAALELIQRSDRGDDQALSAYDLLHQRVTHGRAW